MSSWQITLVILLTALIVIMTIAAASSVLQKRYEVQKAISDNQLEEVKIPKSIFGSGITPQRSKIGSEDS